MLFRIVSEAVRMRVVSAVMATPTGHCVRISPPPRSLSQNAAQWPILQAFADQLTWPVNGQPVKLDAHDWKDILTAAFKSERRVAEGLNGGHVFLGMRTSQMTKREFSEWLDFLHQVAADRGVTVYDEEAIA